MATTVSYDNLSDRVFGLGIALAATTVAAGVMLQYVRRIWGVKTFLKSNFNALKNNNVLAILVTILYFLILLAPLVLLLIWVIILGVNFGATPCLPILFTCLFIFALFIPTRSSLFYYKMLILFILFLAAQLVTMSLAWNYTNPNSFFCLTAVLLIINGIFTSIALWLMDGNCWSLPWALPPNLKKEVMSHFQIWKEPNDPPTIISGGIYFEICTRKVTRIVIIVVLELLAFLTLMTYTLVTYFHTNFGSIGLINSIFVISTDLIVFMLIFVTRQTNISPLFNSISGIVVRICLIAFAGTYWFLGYCLLYLLLMGYISVLIINNHYPTFEKLPTLSVQKVNIFKLPEVPALCLLAMFSGLIFYVGIDTANSTVNTSVPIQNTNYPFWAIGVASILLSFSFMFYLITLRIIQRSRERIRSVVKYYMGFQGCGQYYMFLFFSYAFLVILGIYMYYQVQNHIIWAACVFLPLFYQAFVVFYANWSENDYLLFGNLVAFNKKVKKRIERNKKLQDNRASVIKGIKDKGGQMNEDTKINLMQGAEVESNFMVEKDDRSEYQDWREQHNILTALREDLMLPTDKAILFSIPLMIVSLAAFSIAYWFSQYDHTAFTITAEVSFLFLTLVPMKRYFSTLETPHFTHIISFICGILLNYAYGILSYVLKWNDSHLWTLWWGIINVFILTLYAAFALLRDKGLTLPTIITTLFSMVVSFGIGIIVIAAFGQIVVGIALLGIAFYYCYIVGVIFLYLKRNKSLPWIVIPISAGIIITTCFAIMIYSFVSPDFNDFYGFSITYLVINLLLIGYAAQSLFRCLRDSYDKPNFFSPYGHPLFKYDPEIKSVKDNSQVLVFWIAAWFMYYAYTVLMQIFIADVNIGIAASQIFLIVAFFTTIYFITYNTYKAGKQTKEITVQLLQTTWDEIVKAKEALGTISPNIDDLAAKIEKYKKLEQNGGKVNPSHQIVNGKNDSKKSEEMINKEQNTDIEMVIHDLEQKLEKAIEDQKIELINYWIQISFKIGTSRKKKMLRFTTFIRESEQVLASMGVNIILDSDFYDLQSIYNSALIEYNALSPIQRIQFDKEFKAWMIKKENHEKKNEELNNKHQQTQKKRQEELKKKLEGIGVDDSHLPIQKMRDSPLKLKKIAETLNQPYTDASFRASNDIIPPEIRGDVKGWKRPQPGTVIVREGHTNMSVKQGYLGDCYLISAIGVLGPQHINNVSGIGIWQNPKGAYMVKFKKYNQDIYIIIDSQFPVGDGNSWLFGSCEDNNQLFTNILEKAYAKLHGGYHNIVGGKVSLALADMIGGFPEQIKLKDYQERNTKEIFDKMVEFKKAGYLMGAGSPANQKGDAVDIDGIVQGHAYLILDVRDLDGNKLIKVRNPHGSTGLQSTLDWSDDSPKWNKRLLNLLGEQLKADGAFWLSLEDFVYVFRALYVCRIFDPSTWKTVGPVAGEWKGKTAAGLPTKANPEAKIGDNPQYGIKVSKKCILFVQLCQNETDASRKGKNYIFFMVQKNDGRRISSFSMNKLIGKSGSPINSTSVSGEIILEAPNYPYTFTLLACVMDSGSEGTFSLNFYCDDLSMEVIPHQSFDTQG